MIEQRGWRLAAVALVAGVALAGCSASDSTSKSSGTQYAPGAGEQQPNAAQPNADQQGAAQPGGDQQGKQGADQRGGTPAGNAGAGQYRTQERSIVYTGDLTVRVTDVDQAAARAGALADGAGGFVAGDKRSSGTDKAEAHLTLRVPANRFVATVDGLAKLGDAESRQISTEDVTQQVVDLDAQIASQKASVERTRALLGRAQSISEIVSIEAELAKRESALGTLEARKQRLADLAALSTVTVHLLSPTAAPTPSDERESGFLAGLKLGWGAFIGAVTVLLAILGFLLPFLVVLAVPAGVVWWLIRRRRVAVDAGAVVNPEGARPNP